MTIADPVPALSVVIPVHNESEILPAALGRLTRELPSVTPSFEVLVVENGSRDDTWAKLRALAAADPRIVALQCPFPDYGKALKMGLLAARAERIVSDEIDVLQNSFHQGAIAALEHCDLVIASKRHPDARDDRGFYRTLGTTVITLMLKAACGLKSSDTHGPKAWRRDTARRLAVECVLDGDLFASEAVLRAERSGVRIVELPLSLEEHRAAVIPLAKRIPRVLRDIRKLRKALKSSVKAAVSK